MLKPKEISENRVRKVRETSAIYNYYARFIEMNLSPKYARRKTADDLGLRFDTVDRAIKRIELGIFEHLKNEPLPTTKGGAETTNGETTKDPNDEERDPNDMSLEEYTEYEKFHNEAREIYASKEKSPLRSVLLFTKIYDRYADHLKKGCNAEVAVKRTANYLTIDKGSVEEAVETVESLRPLFRNIEETETETDKAPTTGEYLKNAALAPLDLNEGEKNVFKAVLKHLYGYTLARILSRSLLDVKYTLSGLEDEIVSYARTVDAGREYVAQPASVAKRPDLILEAIESLPVPKNASCLRYAMIRTVLAHVSDYIIHAPNRTEIVEETLKKQEAEEAPIIASKEGQK